MEIWKPTPLAPEHVEASSEGRIRTLDRVAPSKRALQPVQVRAGKLLSPWLDRRGYPMVSVKVGARRPKYHVHRLVAAAFCPSFDPALTVNHIDGNKQNNLPQNLEWITKGENTKPALAAGLIDLRGEKQPTHKLTSDQVREIRSRLAKGERPKQFSRTILLA